ncbi:nucleoside hydrolase [Bacillus sp. SG-1]|uniref:nucleoside hydrolase n=1 Tax=Bacillus sp. SG-1 TaxID=161544 RepID=UPI0001543DD5|nr:nucleoside hydrolase [Bacillus sp. SG-1]EDL66194.1 inosine-uridine nucleoside hydrolase [Bacillus sp. SG-1]
MKKVVLFADPGIDDTFAIIYALTNPEIQLVAIVTGFGNVSQGDATKNAAYILSLAGREDIPVINGASKPLTGEYEPFYPEIHGEDGIGPIKIPDEYKYEAQPFSSILDIIYKHEDLHFVDIGRNTSMALTFNLNPFVKDRIKEVFLMGGAFLVPGNVTEIAEANFHGDPTATNFVLNAGPPVYVAPLNVTLYAQLKEEHIRLLAEKSRNQFKEIFLPIFMFYQKAYEELQPGLEGVPLHDLYTMYLLSNLENTTIVQKKVLISTEEKTQGFTYADFRNMENDPQPNHFINIDFKYEDFLKNVLNTLMGEIKQN